MKKIISIIVYVIFFYTSCHLLVDIFNRISLFKKWRLEAVYSYVQSLDKEQIKDHEDSLNTIIPIHEHDWIIYSSVEMIRNKAIGLKDSHQNIQVGMEPVLPQTDSMDELLPIRHYENNPDLIGVSCTGHYFKIFYIIVNVVLLGLFYLMYKISLKYKIIFLSLVLIMENCFFVRYPSYLFNLEFIILSFTLVLSLLVFVFYFMQWCFMFVFKISLILNRYLGLVRFGDFVVDDKIIVKKSMTCAYLFYSLVALACVNYFYGTMKVIFLW